MLNMSELNQMIIDSLNKSKDAYGNPLYLVVGNTGAGKSTLINYLKRYAYMPGEGGMATLIDPEFKEYAETADRVKAVTTFPAAYKTDEGYILCDCPGFEDNREPERRVAVSVSTEAVVRKAQSIRGLIVVVDFMGLQNKRGENDFFMAINFLFMQQCEIPYMFLAKFKYFTTNRLFRYTCLQFI